MKEIKLAPTAAHRIIIDVSRPNEKTLMKKHLLFLLVPLLTGVIHAWGSNLLTPEWKFSLGDDPVWSDPQYNDEEWPEIQAGVLWEQQGYADYDGYAWYRKSVVIPYAIRDEVIQRGGLLLSLAKIDDVDTTYFNGVELGTTGQFPPDYEGAYNEPRRWILEADQIRWNQPNHIAVRVYDAGGGGGIWGEPVELRIVGVEDQLELSYRMEPADHVIPSPRVSSLWVRVVNRSQESISGQLQLRLKPDLTGERFSRDQRISIEPGSEEIREWLIPELPPGFYSGSIALEAPLARMSQAIGIAVAPESIPTILDRQPDFQQYWDRAREELAAVDPEYRMTRLEAYCTEDKEVYLVEMRSLGNALIRGFYATPTKPGKYPAILHVQGYSSSMQYEYGYQGSDMVVLVLNIRGHGNSQDDVNPGFPGYLLSGIQDPEDYIYRGAYLDCLRAVDFLSSRPEVDAGRIAIEGGSQGGALSLAAAALDARISLCAPSVPFLSDFPIYFKVGNWPANEFEAYAKNHPEFGWEGIYRTLSYIDIKNLAPWITVPVYMQVGLMDEICPPRINFAAYNQLRSPKSFKAYPQAGHGLPTANQNLKIDWIKSHFFP